MNTLGRVDGMNVGIKHFEVSEYSLVAACGASSKETRVSPDNVTCGRCKRTKAFRAAMAAQAEQAPQAEQSGVGVLADLLSLDGETPARIVDADEASRINQARTLRMATKFLAAYAKWVQMHQQQGSRQTMAFGWGGDFAQCIGRARPNTAHDLLVLKLQADALVDEPTEPIRTQREIEQRQAELMAQDLPTRTFDLYERARSLGYDDQAAARVADCFHTTWGTQAPCKLHPGLSTEIDHWGYAIDGCEACKVLALSDAEGFDLATWQAARAAQRAESARLFVAEEDGYAGDTGRKVTCICSTILDEGAAALPRDGRVCFGCGSVFTREGLDASAWVLALSDAVMERNNRVAAERDQHGFCFDGKCGKCLDCLACAKVEANDPEHCKQHGGYNIPGVAVCSGCTPDPDDAAWLLRVGSDPDVEMIGGVPYGRTSKLPIFRNKVSSGPGIVARHRAAQSDL